VGEVAQALLAQARIAPGTARELARRACVGDRVGMYTVSRLVAAGQLVRLLERRPAVLATPDCAGVCVVAEVPSAAPHPVALLLGALYPLPMPMEGGDEPAMA
jgi:hypothetical protein